ncbi:MAG: tetratricopeptide repeat protein [Gammaproteobacteria bacterium]|nr:tetratricopeptide repeat protein [Gammaproteobacteria bacterium]
MTADQAYRNENWALAEADYRRLTTLAPENAEYWFRLGYISARLNRLGDAVRMYGEALERDGTHLGAWHNLGMTQLQLATRSLGRVRSRVPAEDPDAMRAQRIIDGITALLESEQNIGTQAAPGVDQ